MASSQYHFVTRWRVVGTLEEVSEVLQKPEGLPRWWPDAYLEAETLASGDERGIGKIVRVRTRGFLPYALSWQLEVIESRRPHGFTIEADGDFVGRGVWTFEQEGTWVDITFDWQIRVEKPGVKLLSPVLKPLFAANHRWAMRRGEERLRLELERRRAAAQGRQESPARPFPTPRSRWPFLLAGLAVMLGALALAGLLAWPRSPRRRHRHFARRGRQLR